MSYCKNMKLLSKLERITNEEEAVFKNIKEFIKRYEKQNREEKKVIKQFIKEHVDYKMDDCKKEAIKAIFIKKHKFLKKLRDIEETLNLEYEPMVLDRSELLNNTFLDDPQF